MVPKIHKRGVSFGGCARYLLGDRGRVSERVAWTQTHNLITRDPEAAWRVMAATAMDRERLKREAGVKNTGRKSALCVLHFTLSWHAEERAGLTAEEMARAARAVLRVMGAQEHQALVVAHDDTPQPHVLVLVNRVHPRDGRMLASSYEKLKASRWAQRYEEERGKVYCVERVLNNAARERGDYRRGEKDEPRQLHEAAQKAADAQKLAALSERHKRESAKLKQAERELRERTAKRLGELEAAYRERQKGLVTQTRKRVAQARQRTVQRLRPRWRTLHHEQAAARAAHERREGRMLGRVQNALRSVDLRKLVGRGAREGRARTVSEVFRLLVDSGARREALRREQETQRKRLAGFQRKLAERVAERQRERETLEQTALRRRCDAQRAEVMLADGMERAKLRAQWVEKGKWFRAAVRELVGDARAPEAPPKPTANPPTLASDLLPVRGAARAAKAIDQWRVLRAERFGAKPERDGDRQR